MRVAPRILSLLDRVKPPAAVHAHCDLPCGVYDPAQARIEAESVKACMEKYAGSNDAGSDDCETHSFPPLLGAWWSAIFDTLRVQTTR